MTAASGTSSLSQLPPVLNTPIDGSPLSLDMEFSGSPPDTATPNRAMWEQQKLGKVDASASPTVTPAVPSMSERSRLVEVLQTPIAGRLLKVSETPPSSVTMFPNVSYPFLDGSSSGLSVSKRPSLSSLTPSSYSGLAKSSEHSPQLSLLDDGVERSEERRVGKECSS